MVVRYQVAETHRQQGSNGSDVALGPSLYGILRIADVRGTTRSLNLSRRNRGSCRYVIAVVKDDSRAHMKASREREPIHHGLHGTQPQASLIAGAVMAQVGREMKRTEAHTQVHGTNDPYTKICA